jgi:arsenate reductase (glutaredoxin)
VAIILYHNPKCSTSRRTLALLESQGIQPTIVEYLKTPPSKTQLKKILLALGLEPRELMRKKESGYKEARLDDPRLTRAALIAAMVANPRLIERPIVVNGDLAAVGRPPENVLRILKP